MLGVLLRSWGFDTVLNDSFQWRHNGRDGVSNHQPHHCLLNRLFRHTPNKTPKLRVTGLCAGWPVNSRHKWPVTRKMFPFDDVIMSTYRVDPLDIVPFETMCGDERLTELWRWKSNHIEASPYQASFNSPKLKVPSSIIRKFISWFCMKLPLIRRISVCPHPPYYPGIPFINTD